MKGSAWILAGSRRNPHKCVKVRRPIHFFYFAMCSNNYITFKYIVMHINTSIQRAHELSQLVIGAAIEVHRIKGPGLIEEIYANVSDENVSSETFPA
jgi:hypothetical protein